MGEDLFSIKSKQIVVTGSNRGNGLAIATGLIQHGAKVLRIDRHFDSDIGAIDIVFDLSNIDLLPELYSQIYKAFNRVDGLVNNAGISLASSKPYEDLGVFKQTLGVNLDATFRLTSMLLENMSINGGSVINITSLGAELGFPNNPSYQISKAGLRQMTKAIAKDWGHKNIRANNICPGYIRTKMTEKSFNDPEMNRQRLDRMLLNRWGESSDLVGPVIFLISDASSYITGSDIYVDGGWMANGL
jgi:NAD(P)-dependent dehydrogenase (short-subunit alcohol dehydrogenase family)